MLSEKLLNIYNTFVTGQNRRELRDKIRGVRRFAARNYKVLTDAEKSVISGGFNQQKQLLP